MINMGKVFELPLSYEKQEEQSRLTIMRINIHLLNKNGLCVGFANNLNDEEISAIVTAVNEYDELKKKTDILDKICKIADEKHFTDKLNAALEEIEGGEAESFDSVEAMIAELDKEVYESPTAITGWVNRSDIDVYQNTNEKHYYLYVYKTLEGKPSSQNEYTVRLKSEDDAILAKITDAYTVATDAELKVFNLKEKLEAVEELVKTHSGYDGEHSSKIALNLLKAELKQILACPACTEPRSDGKARGEG